MAVQIDDIEYLDGDEAAKLLGVKKATLYAYVSRGALQSYRQQIGRHRLYRRDELERLRAIQPGHPTREGSSDAPWNGLADEAADAQTSSGLPQVETWAGDH
jgi:excisionase family DNA binding protein